MSTTLFADAHWSVDDLVSAYNPTATDDYRRGLGLSYFPNDDMNVATDPSMLDGVLSLWVTEEDDRREYYENLGKWDQFVFGWDDFRRPDDPPAGIALRSDHDHQRVCASPGRRTTASSIARCAMRPTTPTRAVTATCT